jgi:hypothetical protein
MDLTEEKWRGVYWIDLAQDTGKWPAVVNVNYTYGFDKTQGIY